MKKSLVLLLSFAMVMAFALSACGGNQDLSDSKYVGTWQAGSMSLEDESADLKTFWTLTLNGDGTGSSYSVDEDGTEETSNFTWSLTDEGFKTKGDLKLKFTDDGDGIKTSVLGVDLHFARAGEGGEDVVDYIDGAAYGYAGDDPAEAACYQYMAEVIGPQYGGDAEVRIPTVSIVHVDNTPENEILMYGDFWIYNYAVEGDTLKCVSGGNHPGVMHVSKDTYEVTAFDEVADGGAFEESAKEIFGDHYDDFMAVYSDSDALNELRKVTVSDYVNLNGLDINYYQDEGWDPVELYRN